MNEKDPQFYATGFEVSITHCSNINHWSVWDCSSKLTLNYFRQKTVANVFPGCVLCARYMVRLLNATLILPLILYRAKTTANMKSVFNKEDKHCNAFKVTVIAKQPKLTKFHSLKTVPQHYYL
ncbi:hypothetical protein XENOCAPTIV_028240 [Xenoophorus captivus]|uniref:Uncharacterized protein n=1 Tax=Xenoophorus captivus TaxID=1517983 RepID=A0ABV0QLH1_9TELE